MPCSYKPVNRPYDFMNLSPSYQWGIGRVAGYTHFDQAEFTVLEGESTVQWMITMSDKVRGKDTPNPHRWKIANKSHMVNGNMLRGSKFMAPPTIPFNGAKPVEGMVSEGAVVVRSEVPNSGIMFYWDDFTGNYNLMKAGDVLTISVDVRSLGEQEIPQEAVALKATPNFSTPNKVSEFQIDNGFTRNVFTTTVLNTTWAAPEGWEEEWGAVNPELPPYTGRTWNKDRLIGVVQNVENVVLEYARPMVSRTGQSVYEEAPLDIPSTNLWNWSKAIRTDYIDSAGVYQTDGSQEDYVDRTFYSIPTGKTTMIYSKFTKASFQVQKNPDGSEKSSWGKVAFYSSNTEASFISYQRLEREDGKFGGELTLFNIPANAKYFRIQITASSQQGADVKLYYPSETMMEFTQGFYNGISSRADGVTALAKAPQLGQPVRMDFEYDMLNEVRKAFPKIFDGLTTAESVTLLKSILYKFTMTAVVRGGAGSNKNVTWKQIPDKTVSTTDDIINVFRSDSLTSYSHLSTYQTWINDDGFIRGYFLTDSPTSGEQAWIEMDYFGIDYVIVGANTDIGAWDFQSSNSAYTLTSVDTPMMRTEENMQNSSVQVTHGYDIYGEVMKQYPEFFGDCYTYEDCITKLNERIKSFTFEVESYIPDPDIGGEGYVNFVVEATDRIRDSKTKLTKNTQNFITVSNERGNFVKDNGYVYLGGERPPEDRNIELGIMSNITFQLWMDRKYDNDKRIFRYDKKKQPWFLFVRDIKRSVLPPKVNNLVDMNRGRNRYSYGQTEAARTITLSCFIKAESEEEMAPLLEELADYLDVGETTLQLYDSPERVYKVVLDGTTDISQTLHMGEITLNLILLDNYAIGKEVVVRESYSEDTSIPFLQLKNEGTAPTHPKYLLDFKKDSQFVDLIGEQESANISIGRRTKSSPADTNKNLRPQVFYSKFKNDDGAGWISLNDTLMPQYIETQKPTLSGSIQRSNGMMNLNGWKYGDNNVAGLHGHGVIGTLKKNVNNFVCEITPAIYGNSPKNSLNAVYVIFYDEVNNPICHAKIGTRPEDGNIDMYLLEDGNNVNWGRFHQTNGNKWDDFKGKFVIERKNNKWRLTAGQYSNRKFDPAPESNFNLGTSMLKDTKTTGWVTLPTETWDRPVARVGLYLATWKDRPLASHLSVRRCIVWEDLTEESTTPQEKPIIINSGDQVLVDSEKGQVYLNGVLTPKLVDPMTDWFSVDKGDNLIGVNNFVGDLTVIYNERFK